MRARTAFTAMCLIASLAAPAYAWPDGRTFTREVYSDGLKIRTANGSLTSGRISIKVTATLSIQEDGNANWPDDRSCHFRDVRKTLIRSLTLTTADGTEIPVRDTTIVLPGGSEKHWGSVTPCNDKAGEAENYLDEQIGNASMYQSYIDGQRADAMKIVSQFGQVI